MIEVTESTFQKQVLEKSGQIPLLVDFWAAWCAPCRMLMPILSNLEAKFSGKFVLAKVNTDEERELAAGNNIRSLPTLKLFVQGKVVEEMLGVHPEKELEEMLARHIPRESDGLRAQAAQQFAAGDSQAALTLLQQAAAQDPDNSRVALDMAQIHMQMGAVDAASAVLRSIPLDKQADDAFKSANARLQLMQQLPQGATLQALRDAAKSGDDQARIHLAIALAVAQQYREALDLLLQTLSQPALRDAARGAMVHIFEIISADHPEWVTEYRGKMFRALH